MLALVQRRSDCRQNHSELLLQTALNTVCEALTMGGKK